MTVSSLSQPSAPARVRLWPGLAAALGSVLLALLVFGGGLNAFFLGDDFIILLAQRQGGPFSQFTRQPSDFFRPLSALSFYFDQQVWGLNPFGFHLTAILLHALNAFLVVQVGRLLVERLEAGARRAWQVGLAAGLSFLIHPVHSEAVNWMAARMDLLAALFGLLALWSYLRYQEQRLPSYLLFSLLMFATGLLAKEAVVTFPLIVVLLELWEAWRAPQPLWPTLRRRLAPVLAFFAVLPVYLMARSLALGALLGGYGSAAHLSLDPKLWLRHLATQLLRVTLPPVPLQPQAAVSPVLYLPVTALAGAVLAWLAWQTWTSRRAGLPYTSGHPGRPAPALLLCLALALGAALLPVLTLYVSLINVANERLLYWPSAFAVLLVVVALQAYQPRRLWPAVFLVVLLYLPGLWRSNQTWRLASQISQAVVASLVELPPAGHNVLVNLPDNVEGAIIFRNGLDAAAQLYGDNHQGSLEALGYAILAKKNQVITLQAQNDRVAVWTDNCTSIVNPAEAAERYRLEPLPGCGFSFQLPPGEEDIRILSYTNSQLMEFAP